MSEFVNSLKRLYDANKITESAVVAMYKNATITSDEKDYILRKDG